MAHHHSKILARFIPLDAETENNIALPDENDLYKTIRDLVVLQRGYDLDIMDMVKGRLATDSSVESALTSKLNF
jgi:hypothetical protein